MIVNEKTIPQIFIEKHVSKCMNPYENQQRKKKLILSDIKGPKMRYMTRVSRKNNRHEPKRTKRLLNGNRHIYDMAELSSLAGARPKYNTRTVTHTKIIRQKLMFYFIKTKCKLVSLIDTIIASFVNYLFFQYFKYIMFL